MEGENKKDKLLERVKGERRLISKVMVWESVQFECIYFDGENRISKYEGVLEITKARETSSFFNFQIFYSVALFQKII